MCEPPPRGFPERPVLVAHETPDRQQLRLPEDVLGHLTPLRRHRRLRNGTTDQRETHQSTFGPVNSPPAAFLGLRGMEAGSIGDVNRAREVLVYRPLHLLPMRLHDPRTDIMEYYCSPSEQENYNKVFQSTAPSKGAQ